MHIRFDKKLKTDEYLESEEEDEASYEKSEGEESSEDEDGFFLTPKVGKDVLKTWILLKEQNEKIYDPNVQLTESIFYLFKFR